MGAFSKKALVKNPSNEKENNNLLLNIKKRLFGEPFSDSLTNFQIFNISDNKQSDLDSELDSDNQESDISETDVTDEDEESEESQNEEFEEYEESDNKSYSKNDEIGYSFGSKINYNTGFFYIFIIDHLETNYWYF